MIGRFILGALALMLCFAPYGFMNRFEPWQLMCIEAMLIFVVAKGWLLATVSFPSRSRAALFVVLNMDMDPAPFVADSHCPRPEIRFLAFPIFQLLFGVALIWIVAPKLLLVHHLLAGCSVMVGAVLVLHHAISSFFAFALREAGIAADPIMKAPLLSTSVRDFLSMRWNIAVRSLAHRLIFRPLSRRWGPLAASWAVFVISGIVHEMVITIPAGGGYGGPMVYFLIQPIAIMAEKKFPTLRAKGWSRAWTYLVVLCPAPLLFPPIFIERVILPFFVVLGVQP